MLQFYNTLSKNKEIFKPIKGKKVKLYSCGPTVYNFAHIGNLRSFVFVDLLKRYMKFRGYKVQHVMNITDVDDKTIKGAKSERKSLKEFTNFYTNEFLSDLKKLNIERPNYLPKATDHIKEMVSLILNLKKNGFTYEKNGSIYFKISKFQNYGALTEINKQDLKQNAEGRLNTSDEYEKENVGDFALWKAWTPEDGDVFWHAKIGKGRPGWHIECSAMSMKYLGKHFDIHTGGVDLAFPHHTNEIAQSEAATGKKFVNFWLHNEHLLVQGKKMSKSQGNYFNLRDFEQKNVNLLVFRLILLKNHYRQKLDFHFGLFDEAESIAEKFINFLILLDNIKEPKKNSEYDTRKILKSYHIAFTQAMDDDLNISEALSIIFKLINEISNHSKVISKKQASEIKKFIFNIDNIFGFIKILYTQYLRRLKEVASQKNIKQFLISRNIERKAGNYDAADKIRKELEHKGVLLRDTQTGTIVELKQKV